MTSPRLSKTLNEIRSEIFARMEEVQDEYTEKGYLPARLNLNKGIARGLIELFAWGQWQLYAYLDNIHSQAIPLQSSGEWLDVHAAQVGLTRKSALKAAGTVLFHRAGTNAERNIPIPAGRIVRTLPDGRGEIYRYVTTAAAVIPAGNLSVGVSVESESYGSLANAAVGQICELVTPVTGIGSVENTAGWLESEGSDGETDAALRRRYALAWAGQAGMTRAAYESAALAVPGVMDVFVADQHPRGEGTVDIIVQGAAGLPTAALLEAVRQNVADIIVINDDVLVKSPESVSVSVSLVIELLSGDAANIKAQAEDYVARLFACDPDVPGFGIGTDVIRDRIAAGIVTIAGVKRIIWTSPAADITITSGQLAVLSSLVVTTQWATEA